MVRGLKTTGTPLTVRISACPNLPARFPGDHQRGREPRAGGLIGNPLEDECTNDNLSSAHHVDPGLQSPSSERRPLGSPFTFSSRSLHRFVIASGTMEQVSLSDQPTVHIGSRCIHAKAQD